MSEFHKSIKLINKSSGIYLIRNILNNKIYVGSAKNCRKRLYSHLTDLKKQKHHSILLQRSFNKYGESKFITQILEYVDSNKLIEREQHYIDLYKSSNKLYGFNICKEAKSAIGYKHREETKIKMHYSHSKQHKFVTPEGKLLIVDDLINFCKSNNLKYFRMKDLSIGSCKYYCGYVKYINDGSLKPYDGPKTRIKHEGVAIDVVDPDGKLYKFISKKAASKFIGCSEETLLNLSFKLSKQIKSGWRLADESTIGVPYEEKSIKLVDPNGKIITIYKGKLTEFCRLNNLHRTNIYSMVNGYYKQIKGYKIYKKEN